MDTKTRSLALIPTALTLAVSTQMPVRAAEGTAVMLEEIVVTARKREESLSDAPLSVSAFSGAQLEYRGTQDLSDIAKFTPNLTFQNNPSFGGAGNAAAIYIRGIGQKEFLPTTEPGVGLYVDEVYVARSVGAILDIVDVERVEVLRGPQGTLFGRNTIGGAISVTTIKPNEEFYGRLESTVGTDDRLDLKGTVNLPFSDNLFGRLTVASLQQDGYVDLEDGTDTGDADTLTVRAALRFLPSDSLTLDWNVEYTDSDDNGPAMVLEGINLGNPIDPDTPPFAVIHNVGANLAAGGGPEPCANPAVTLKPAVPGCYDYRYVQGDSNSAGTLDSFSDTELWGSSLVASWDLSESLTLKSITAYRDLDAEFARDGDHSPHRIAHYHDTLEQDQFTQEFQLLGSSMEEKLQWILGLYYFEEDGDNVNTLDFVVSNFRSGGSFDNTSAAAFAQATYEITPQWSVTAGLRYTDEEKKFHPDQVIYENYFAGTSHPQLDAPFMQAGQRILPDLEKEITTDETDPMLNVAYRPTEDWMFYATYSEGFKSGGFTQRVFPPQVQGFTAPADAADIDLIPTFDPEYVEVYELGFKYATSDNRLQVNGAIFQTDYDDLQIQVFTSVAPVTRNAASAEIQGFELDAKWAPGNNWFLDFAAGYIDPEYKDIDEATTFVSEGNEFERASEWTLSGGVSKEFELDRYGRIVSRLDWSYRDEFYNDTFNTPAIAQDDSINLFNATLAWSSRNDEWLVSAGVLNFSDEDYVVTGVFGDAMQAQEVMPNRGREWYLTLRKDFR